MIDKHIILTLTYNVVNLMRINRKYFVRMVLKYVENHIFLYFDSRIGNFYVLIYDNRYYVFKL